MPEFSVNISNKKFEKDSLKVNLGAGSIAFTGRMLKFRDKDTRQIVFYLPSLDLTGYGNTDAKAIELLNFSVNEYFMHLSKLTYNQIKDELTLLGWKISKTSIKQFSKVFVDPDGQLQNFNAVADQVEQLAVQI